MIIELLIAVVMGIFTALFSIFPVVTIASIPYIGTTVSGILTTMVAIWNSFIITFPYAGIAWNVFLLVIIPFEILMLILKFFLGSRAPHSQPQ